MTATSRADAFGTEPIGRVLWHACLQTTLSVGIYGVYTLTNAWFVARGVGEDALAAVSVSAPILLLLGAVSTTVGVGGASLVSRSLGAGRTDDAAAAAGNAFVLFWAVAVTVSVLGLLVTDPLLRLLGARGDTLDAARPYTRVLLAGAVCSTGFSALVRAEGRLRFSTMLWVIPVLVHIVLDPLLIYGFHLGVTGAALGTVGGQLVSAGMSLWCFFVRRDRAYRITWAELRPRRRVLGALLGIGAPSFLTGLGATLLVVLINANLARRTTVTTDTTTTATTTATVSLAAFAVCSRIQTFVSMPQLGITQGVQPIVGYNHGRAAAARVERARTLALRSTLLYGTVMSLAVSLGARHLVRWFVDDARTVAMASSALRIIAVAFVFSGIAPLVSAYFQAIGHAPPSYLISVGTLLVIKLPLVALLAPHGPTATWAAIPAGEALAATVALAVLARWRRDAAARTDPSRPRRAARSRSKMTA